MGSGFRLYWTRKSDHGTRADSGVLSFSSTDVTAFLRGDLIAWNPFDISAIERAFLLFHLGEVDEVLWQVAVGGAASSDAVDLAAAHRVTAQAMEALVKRVEKHVPMSELPRLRILKGARPSGGVRSGWDCGTHKHESGTAEAHTTGRWSGRSKDKVDQECRSPSRTAASKCSSTSASSGRTCFRALLGASRWRARNAWTYQPTDAGQKFSRAVSSHGKRRTGPLALVVLRDMCGGGEVSSVTRRPYCSSTSSTCSMKCYGRIARRHGHSPFETVALLTMLEGFGRRGAIIEMADLHRLFIELKSSGALETSSTCSLPPGTNSTECSSFFETGGTRCDERLSSQGGARMRASIQS